MVLSRIAISSCVQFFSFIPLFLPQIDLKKMPLGKLSKKQIESAYKVLNELNEVGIASSCIDMSGQFCFDREKLPVVVFVNS